MSNTSPAPVHSIAIVGGMFARPDYPQTYLKSAAVLVSKARASGRPNELALPCVSLQRQCLELSLKTLLHMLHGIGEHEHEHSADSKPRRPMMSSDDHRQLDRTHDLDELLGFLHEMVRRSAEAGFVYVELPVDLGPLVHRFVDLDRNSAARFRYPVVKPRGRPAEASFADVVEIPIGELQARLEAVYAGLFGEPDSPVIDTIGRDLDVIQETQWIELRKAGSL